MDCNGSRVSVLDKCRIGTKYINMSDDDGCTACDFNMRYVNRTRSGIWLKTRQGVDTYFPAMTNATGWVDEVFEITLEWRMPEKVFRRTQNDLANKHRRHDTLLASVLRAFDDANKNASAGNRRASLGVSLKFSEEDLTKLGGAVYLDELDITLVIDGDKNRDVEHPFSPTERQRKSFMGVVPHMSNETLVYSIKAVENGPHRHMADRFVALGDKVYKVPIERDSNLVDGVHLVCRNSTDVLYRGDDTKSMVHTHYSFAEADKIFGMKLSSEEAGVLGDRDLAQKKQFQDNMHAQRMEELDRKEAAALLAATLAAEQHARDAASILAKETAHLNKVKEETVKESAKNFGEWMKLVAACIAGMASMAGFLVKLRPVR